MKLTVRYRGHIDCPVIGVLASDARGKVFFEFDSSWRASGLDLSPVKLPLATTGAVTTGDPAFSSLFGLFDDSLPDWWGQRLMRLHFEEMNMPWSKVEPLEKLACQGAFGLGALSYEPDISPKSYRETIATEVSEMVVSARQLTHGESSQVIPALIRGGLSPGGAQPKALISFNEDFTQSRAGGGESPSGFSQWLVKFQIDPEFHLCRQEHALSMMASAAGIRVPETRLFLVEDGSAHFMSKRFDRDVSGALHYHSYAGLTHTPVRDLIDYSDLLDLTRGLTGREAEIEEMFRRAVFNIAIANDDDHSRNHGYLMDAQGDWSLSPAFDITRSGYALGSGYRAAGVLGKFSNLGIPDLQALATSQGIRRADDQIGQILDAIRKWPEFAQEAGLPENERKLLADEFPASRW